MSAYEDYECAADAYAKWRKPLGVSIVVGYFFDLLGRDPTILDVGCGPGSYARHLASLGAKVTGLDVNERQLYHARQSLIERGWAPDSITFVKGDARCLPFKDSSFNGVLQNMVLHHLDSDSSRSGVTGAIQEASRVLSSGGVLIIGTVSKEQAVKGAWYYDLCPELSDRFTQRLLDDDELVALCEKSGLSLFDKVVPLIQVFRPVGYFDPSSIRSASERCSISLFSFLSDQG